MWWLRMASVITAASSNRTQHPCHQKLTDEQKSLIASPTCSHVPPKNILLEEYPPRRIPSSKNTLLEEYPPRRISSSTFYGIAQIPLSYLKVSGMRESGFERRDSTANHKSLSAILFLTPSMKTIPRCLTSSVGGMLRRTY